MKRLTVILCTAVLLLTLFGCGGRDEPSAASGEVFGGDLLAKAQQKAAEKEAAAARWVEEDGDEPFGQYRSVEQLRAIIENGVNDEAATPITWETPTLQPSDGGEAYAGSAESTTFSEEGWPEPGVEYHLDWQSQQAADLAAEGLAPSTIIGPDGKIDMEELMRQSREKDEQEQTQEEWVDPTADGVFTEEEYEDYLQMYEDIFTDLGLGGLLGRLTEGG